jgi:hypothetical protein
MKAPLSSLVAWVCLPLAIMGLSLACTVNASQVTGIYTGAITDAAEQSQEIWLQLYSNGTFWLRQTQLAMPASTRVRNGTWLLRDNGVVLMVMGEKDLRFRWEHGFLRHEASSIAHPGWALDMVSLQRIGQ